MTGAMVDNVEVYEIFLQFIVWEGIPSSLPFGTDVVPKSRRASAGGMGIVWRKLE